VNGSPWAFSPEERLDWADGLNIKVASRGDSAEYLFWVGCAGAFDARYKKVSRALVKILQLVGIDFMVLGKEEKCNGDAARRLGNEYLAQMLIKENIQTLENYGVKKIITTCPHCFHSLKNEYKLFGGNYDVIHHSELIQQFISSEKLKLKNTQSTKITYHDSCYLGRYNNIYEQPRKIINQISGLNLVEMNRSKDKGFCCGAGGGRMWMEETQGKRINIERTEEALALNPDCIASACPFCLTMLEDGIKSKEVSEKVKVKDLAEIVADAIE
ncbi:MAG: (Fe-S)-binding protein, partial [Ignavibacteria bacterium]|nr:(Fe-S)-binding protein [Ignavibacteria bacterium]